MGDSLQVMQVIASLATVLLLIWVAARFAMKRGLSQGNYPHPLKVRSRVSLTRGTQVVVVRHADTDLVLGVTEHNISVLKESIAEPDLEPAEHEQSFSAGSGALARWWRNVVRSAQERTVRK